MMTEITPQGGQEEEGRSKERLGSHERKEKDKSFDLAYALLADLKESFGRVDERTKNLTVMTEEIKGDVRTIRDKQGEFVTEKFAWRFSALLVSVIGIIVALLHCWLGLFIALPRIILAPPLPKHHWQIKSQHKNPIELSIFSTSLDKWPPP